MKTRVGLSRRHFLSLVAATGGAAALSACTGAATTAPTAAPAEATAAPAAEATATTAPAEVAEPITITYLTREYESTGDWAETRKGQVERFAAAFPNAKAEEVFIPEAQYMDKLQTMIAAGNPPDIFNVDPTSQFLTWIKNETIVDVQAAYEKDKDFFSDWPEFFIKAGTWDGKLYGLSIDGGAIYNLWSNFGWFREKGIEPPVDKEYSIDEFLEICQTLSNPEEKLFAYNPFTCVWHWWAMAFGGNVVDPAEPTKCKLDLPESMEALQFLVDLRWKYNVAPQPAQEVEGQSGRQGYVAKRVAMVHAGAWFLPSLEGSGIEAGALLPPKGKNEQVCMSTIQMWVIYAGAKNPDMCWEFNKVRSDEESMKAHVTVEGATVPSRKINEELWAPHMQELLDAGKGYENYQCFMEGYEYARLWAQMPQEAWDIMTQELDAVWLNQTTVEEYVANTVPKVDKALQDWWSA